MQCGLPLQPPPVPIHLCVSNFLASSPPLLLLLLVCLPRSACVPQIISTRVSCRRSMQTDPRSVFACAEILIKLKFTFRHVSDSGVFSGLTVCLVWHTHCQLTHSAASTFRGRNRIRNLHHIHILSISSHTLGQPTEFYDTFYSFFFSHSFSLIIQLNLCLVCVLIA